MITELQTSREFRPEHVIPNRFNARMLRLLVKKTYIVIHIITKIFLHRMSALKKYIELKIYVGEAKNKDNTLH